MEAQPSLSALLAAPLLQPSDALTRILQQLVDANASQAKEIAALRQELTDFKAGVRMEMEETKARAGGARDAVISGLQSEAASLRSEVGKCQAASSTITDAAGDIRELQQRGEGVREWMAVRAAEAVSLRDRIKTLEQEVGIVHRMAQRHTDGSRQPGAHFSTEVHLTPRGSDIYTSAVTEEPTQQRPAFDSSGYPLRPGIGGSPAAERYVAPVATTPSVAPKRIDDEIATKTDVAEARRRVDELYLLLGTTSLQVQAALATGTAERVRFLHGLPVWRAFWTELVQLKERVGQFDHVSAVDESAIRQSINASVDRASSGPRDAPAHPAALIASDVSYDRRLPTPQPEDPSLRVGAPACSRSATSSPVPSRTTPAAATPQPLNRAPTATDESPLTVSAAEALAVSASAAARYAMAEVSARKALASARGAGSPAHESTSRSSPPPDSSSPNFTRQTVGPSRTAIATSALASNDSTPTVPPYGERASQAQANLARELAAHRHQFVASTPRSQSAAHAWHSGGAPSGESMFVPGLGADVAPRRMERHRALDRHSSPGREGVIVVRIVTGSTLDRSGVSVGDCLLTVDGGAIVDGEHLAEVIESLPPEHCPQITVMPHARATKTPLTVHLAPAE